MKQLVISKQTADKIKGTYGYAALDPVELKSGEYMLPVDVLEDKAYGNLFETVEYEEREVSNDEIKRNEEPV